MKKWLATSLISSLVLALALVVASPASSKLPASAASPAAAAAPAPVPQDHPEIRDAIAALRTARGHLKEARHDFGGHRAEALRDVDKAINQLQVCMRYDK